MDTYVGRHSTARTEHVWVRPDHDSVTAHTTAPEYVETLCDYTAEKRNPDNLKLAAKHELYVLQTHGEICKQCMQTLESQLIIEQV